MADYYALIDRAVGGLDRNTGEHRRALYDRARAALVSQLRGVHPALDETDITRERLALEEAIRKVEAETAKRTRADVQDDVLAEASLRDRGLRDFRETVAEAEGLGGAAAEARRAAHATYDAMPDASPRNVDYRNAESARVSEPRFTEETFQESHAPPSPSGPAPYEDEELYARPARSYGGIIKWAVILAILAGGAGAAYWQRHAITSMVASFRSQPAPKPLDVAQPTTRPKIADRIGQSQTNPHAANAPAVAFAKRVVLYDEDPNDPQGKRYVGSALWRTEPVSLGPGLATELAVRADIEIPERKLRMTWSLRRNSDKALPASHTIEIMFTLPVHFPEGGIGNVPGVLMKQSEQARGVPLAG